MDTSFLQINLNQLIELKLLLIPKLKVDGIIGASTKEAITLFQFTQDLPPTGVLDFITQEKLIQYLGPNLLMESMMSDLTKLRPEDFVNSPKNKDILILHALQNGIINRNELAMFLAQCSHESMNFTRLEESFKYRPDRLYAIFPKYFKSVAEAQAALAKGDSTVADIIYLNRMGNTAPGDGYKYRGRSYIQITGKDNYTHYGTLTGLDLVNNPDLCKMPANAATVSVAYWQNREGLSQAGQAGDVRTSTRLINGGYNGLDDRERLFKEFLLSV